MAGLSELGGEAQIATQVRQLVRDRTEHAVVVEAGLADRDDPLFARPTLDGLPAGVIDLGGVVRVHAHRGIDPGHALGERQRALRRGDVPAWDEQPLHAGGAGRLQDGFGVIAEAIGVDVAVRVDEAHRRIVGPFAP